MKVVINNYAEYDYGGALILSKKGILKLKEFNLEQLLGKEFEFENCSNIDDSNDDDDEFAIRIDRHNSFLIKIIEEIGIDYFETDISSLHIIEIPDGIDYEIEWDDAGETIYEVGKRWN